MVYKLTEENFDATLANAEGLILVDFWAAWCGPCRMLGKILNELSDEQTNTVFYKVNVDENQSIADQFRITSLPTVIVFEKGQVRNTLVGVRPKGMYKEILT